MVGAITGYIDVAQVVLYVFWFFFAGLILYLHREGKREGYPLIDDSQSRGRFVMEGFPGVPSPKEYLLEDGSKRYAPNLDAQEREVPLTPAARHPGAALEPTGNPLRDGVGPAAWATRADEPEYVHHGDIRVVPLRNHPDYSVHSSDPDPRGMEVIAADGVSVGRVVDLWIDRGDVLLRYFEIELAGEPDVAAVVVEEDQVDGTADVAVVTADIPGVGSGILVPIQVASVHPRRGKVVIDSVLSSQFMDAPRIAQRDRVTMLEEDKISAYFSGGYMYATPRRAEPLL